MTLILLAVYRKALPALPISVTLGIIFYFGSAYTMSPHLSTIAAHGVVV